MTSPLEFAESSDFRCCLRRFSRLRSCRCRAEPPRPLSLRPNLRGDSHRFRVVIAATSGIIKQTWAKRDSNSHDRSRHILSVVRLPIPPFALGLTFHDYTGLCPDVTAIDNLDFWPSDRFPWPAVLVEDGSGLAVRICFTISPSESTAAS
jgi:hypothetical protein